MRVRYYVLAKGQQFEIFREDVRKGESTLCSRAIDFGKVLARLETRFTRVPTEVMVEASDGRLNSEIRFDPPPIREPGPVVSAGQVLES